MGLRKQPGCWLRSSHSFKECVIAHWSSEVARKITGAKLYTEIANLQEIASGRGAICKDEAKAGRHGGRSRRENAGMSSEIEVRNF